MDLLHKQTYHYVDKEYIYAHVMNTNEVLILTKDLYFAYKSFNSLNTHLYILNLNTLIY